MNKMSRFQILPVVSYFSSLISNFPLKLLRPYSSHSSHLASLSRGRQALSAQIGLKIGSLFSKLVVN